MRHGAAGTRTGSVVLGCLLVTAAILVLPSWAASQAMSDQELDHVTAAGQPAVVTAGSGSVVEFAAATDIALDIAPNSQAGLRALVLNNVAGENQIANGLNISGSSTNGDQTNGIGQSWGSINDTEAVVVPGVTAAADLTCSGLICKQVASASAAPGTVRVLGVTGDQIVTGGAASALTYRNATAVAMTIDTNSQANLIALVVNNVAGLNQVGNAINMKGGGVSLTDNALVVSAGAAQGGGQSNVINQYRGTPSNFTR